MYEFYYPESGVIQRKLLIPHEQYLTFKVLPEDSNKQEKRKKQLEKEITHGQQWFTDQSPLYESISTGVLECNGRHKVKAKQVI